MKIAKIKGKGSMLQLQLSDTNDWYVNVVRRLILSDVPTIAIEIVEIQKNDSILYDEVLSHRLGLVPLTTDLKSYRLPSAEEIQTQEYLAQSSCKFTLEAKGPCIVYAKDLKSKDPKVKPAFPDMPLTKLLEGQEIRLEATAVMGVGRTHAKWSPGHTFYRRIPEITIKSSNLACAQVCPTGTLADKGGKLQVTDEKTCILCMACVDVDSGKSVDVKPGTDFLLHVESYGQLESAEIVEKAIEVFNVQLKEFDQLVKQAE